MGTNLNIGTLTASLVLDNTMSSSLKSAVGDLQSFDKTLGKWGDNTRAAGTKLTAGLTLPIAGFMTAAIAAGSEFERTMNQVNAITNGTADDQARLTATASEWGQKTKFSNREAAEAMLELGKAGFNTDQIIGALPSTLQLATSANMGLGEAASLTANVMNTFGLAAADLAHSNDILTEAANNSTIDVTDLRETLKFVGPVANIAQISLSDVAAASAVLGQNGIKAEMAGTALRGMFAKLLSPTKTVNGLLKELGFEQEVAAGKTVVWTDMLEALNKKFGEGQDTVDEFSGRVMDAFGLRAGPAIIAMAGEGGKAIHTMSEELDASSGAAKRMTDAFMKGLPGAMETTKGSIETMLSTSLVALEPALTKIATLVGSLAGFVTNTLVPAFTSLPEPVQTGIIAIVGLAAAIGPAMVVIGTLASAISAAIPIVTTIGGTIAAVATGPFGLLVAAVVGLGAAWITWGDDVTRIVSETYTAVKTWLWDKLEPVLVPIGSLLISVGEMFSAFGALVGAVGMKVVEYVQAIYRDVKSWLLDKLKPVIDPLKLLVQSIAIVYDTVRDKVIGYVQALYNGVKTWLLDKFVAIVEGVKTKIDAVTGFFRDMYDKVVGNSYVPDLIQRIGEEFKLLQSRMVTPAQAAVDIVVGAFFDLNSKTGMILKELGGVVTGGLDGIKAYGIQFAKDFVTTSLDILVPGLGQLVSAAWPVIQQGLIKIGQGIKAAFSGIWSGIKGLFGFGGDNGNRGEAPDERTGYGPSPVQTGYEDGRDPGNPNNPTAGDGGMMDLDPSGGSREGYARGTGGRYVDFGRERLVNLHDREGVVRPADAPTIGADIAASLGPLLASMRPVASGQAGGNVYAFYGTFIDRESIRKFFRDSGVIDEQLAAIEANPEDLRTRLQAKLGIA